MAEAGEGTFTLILIPGLLCDERVWPAQRAALSDLADVRVAEHGMCDSLPQLAQRILDDAPPRFAVAGHSMGGRIVLEVFRAAPERVIGMSLMDTGYRALPAGEAGEREAEGRFALLAKARSQGMRAMAHDWVQGMVHPARLADRALIDGILDMFESKTPDLYAAQIHALLSRPDGSALLPLIRCPTLVLCGNEDSWAPPLQHREITDAIPGSRLSVVPECGHMATLERPGAVSEAMRAWLQDVLNFGKERAGAGNDPRAAAASGAR